MLFVLLLYFLAFAWLSWRNLLYGLLLIAAFLPSYLIRFQIFGLPLTVLEVMILIVVAVWVVKNRHGLFTILRETKNPVQLLKKLPDQNRVWFWTILVFFLAATISMVISPNTRSAWGIWKAYFLEPILLFSVFISTVKTAADRDKILYALTIGALAVAIFAVIQKFTGWLIPNPFWQAAATRRVTSFFGYPNAVALYLAPLLPLIIYLAATNRSRLQTALLVFTALASILAIVFAKSTGAIIALLITTIIFLLIQQKTRKLTIAIIILAALLWPLWPGREDLIKEVWVTDGSGKLRLYMWAETVEMLKTKPLLGAGLATYQEAVRPYHILKWAEIYLYPHNLFLNFWSETGLLGLLIFAILIWLYYQELWLAPKPGLTTALALSMMVLLIHGLVDVPYFKNDLAVLFWLLIGLALLNRRVN